MNDYLAAERLGLTLRPVNEDEKVIYIALVMRPRKAGEVKHEARAQLAHDGQGSEVYAIQQRVHVEYYPNEGVERLDRLHALMRLFRELAEVLIDSPAMKGTEK